MTLFLSFCRTYAVIPEPPVTQTRQRLRYLTPAGVNLTQRVYGKLNACRALLFYTVCRARVYTTDAPPRRVCRAKYGVQTRWYRFPNRHQKKLLHDAHKLARFIN